MSLAQVEHTDTGLSDPSSNCIREFPAEERFLEIQFGSKAVKVEVLNVQETVKKEEAQELYRYL